METAKKETEDDRSKIYEKKDSKLENIKSTE